MCSFLCVHWRPLISVILTPFMSHQDLQASARELRTFLKDFPSVDGQETGARAAERLAALQHLQAINKEINDLARLRGSPARNE